MVEAGRDREVGEYSFRVEPFHADFKGRLTLGVLGNYLLNCAGLHAAERGFGIASLNECHYTWVLSRLALELTVYPMQYEMFSIRTWVENVYRLFTDRNFELLDQAGKPIGYVRSVWAMIDVGSRKPVDLLNMHEGHIMDYVCNKPCPIEKPGRVKVSPGLEPVWSRQARYSDIDVNGHVNSVKYIEHILDLFPIELFEHKRISRFEIAYVAECRYGDQLSFFMDEPVGDEYHVEIRKNDAEVVARSKVRFN